MANLNPDYLKRLQALANPEPGANFNPHAFNSWIDTPEGMTYMLQATKNGPEGEAGADIPMQVGDKIVGWKTDQQTNKDATGDYYSLKDGSYAGQALYEEPKDWMVAAMLAASVGGMMAAPALAGGAASGGGGLMTVPTAAELGSTFAADFAPYLTGFSEAGGAGSLLESAGGESGFDGALQGYTHSPGDAFMPGKLGAGGANMGSGILPGLEQFYTGTAAASGGLKGLLGDAGKYLVPALGALGGAQKNEKETTQTQRMDPRLDEFVYGDLLPRTRGLLADSMSPERMKQWETMRNTGMGLLQSPVASNGFGLFYPPKR